MALVAYVVNENNGRKYRLFRIMTIGAAGCDIECESIAFTMRIYHVRFSHSVFLQCNNIFSPEHVKVNGFPVIGNDYGFRSQLHNFDLFCVDNTSFRVYILSENQTFVERTIFNGKLLPMSRVLPNSF